MPHQGDASMRAMLLPAPPPPAKLRLLLPFLIAAAFAGFYHFPLVEPSPSYYQSLLLSLGSNDTAAAHLRALTARPHLAGSDANALAAAHVATTLSSHGFPTRLTPYSVLLSYPAHRSLSLSAPGRDDATVTFALKQETYPGDPYAAVSAEAVPTFLAYAASGSVTAEAVYANYGRVEDYAYLAARGVNVTGKVAVARYGKVYRGDIVNNARDAGAAAAVIYTDAKDYRPGKAFPDGPGMPPTGVQVGSTFKGVGDPTTPMGASSEGCERLSVTEAMASDDMPGIPALPVSGRDGEAILRLIGGEVAPEDWQGADGAPVYRLGPGPAVLNLTYTGNETMATIQNVISVIEGKEEPERYVILGNHRDAWTFGAVDPNSGTAALLELAQRFYELKKKGWKPRRTIILCNWDAEEYGLIGSTEWVEENRAMLASRTVAYLNVDSAVAGPGFYASATPQLDELLKDASKQVQSPDNGTESLYDLWMASNTSPLIERLGGGGSDYSAFVQHIGVPSADMSMGPGMQSIIACMMTLYGWKTLATPCSGGMWQVSLGFNLLCYYYLCTVVTLPAHWDWDAYECFFFELLEGEETWQVPNHFKLCSELSFVVLHASFLVDASYYLVTLCETASLPHKPLRFCCVHRKVCDLCHPPSIVYRFSQ